MSKSRRNCCFCSRTIDTEHGGRGGDDFVRLSCGCISCPKCIIKRTINRKTNVVKCLLPEHNDSNETRINKLNYFCSLRDDKFDSVPIEVEDFELTIENDPIAVFAEEFLKDKKEMVNTMFLNLTYVSKPRVYGEEHQIRSVTTVLDSKYGFESEKEKDNLRIIFGLLHAPIINQHKIESKCCSSFPRMTASQFCDYCLERDNSTLLKLIYALTTGLMRVNPSEINKSSENKDKEATRKLSNFLAVCVAKSMIERANTYVPGPFQLMIADMLSLVNAPNPIKDFLSKIRLSTGRRTIDRTNLRNEIISLRKRLILKPTDAFVVSFDNFSFMGHKGQHAMHTILQIMIISEKKLRKLGFYDNNRICRTKITFEALMEEYDNDSHLLAKTICIPNKNDYRKLSERIFQTIKTVVSLNLPTVDECRQMINSRDKTQWPYLIPSNLGVIIATANNTKSTAVKLEKVECSIDLIEADTQQKEDSTNNLSSSKNIWKDPPSTFYEKNNVVLDHVLHGDPGSDIVMAKVVEYLDKASEVDDVNYNETGGEEPVRSIIAPATADGGPAKRWLDFQSLDIQNARGNFDDRRYKKPRVFVAGLHYMMEFLSMRGRLCRDLTSYFARRWRPTEKGLNWIYLIRDPNDGLEEWRDYMVAQYKAASESANSNNAITVHRYMIKRAIEVPMCQGILFDLRLLEIVFMIRDSEKAGTHGDVPLFLTCMRFSLPLFAITHAINYCHLVCDFLEWYKMASQAEKILFDNFFYTKLSVGGKPIWADRGVEWTVGHIRKFMGRRIRQHNHDEAVERLVADLSFRVRAKSDLRYVLNFGNHENYSTSDWNDQTFQIGPAFLHTREALYDTNLWGPGPLQGDLECSSNDSIIMADSTGKEYTMSSSILKGYQIGIERILAYYVKHHCDNRYQKTRTEKSGTGVNLKTLPTTHDRRLKDIEITAILRYSCNYSKILSLKRDFPKSGLVDDLNYYRQFIPNMPIYSDTTHNRSTLAEAVCKYRRKYFDLFPEVEQSLIDSVNELDESEGVTTQATRRDQIEHSLLYSLDENVLMER